jgi:glycerol uptake facilitator protein/aquaporin Z
MVSTTSALARKLLLARSTAESALTTVVLFVAVTIVRWLRDPGSLLYIADLKVALVVIGALSGTVLTGLILSPLGRRSGGHMNPAVTVALWGMRAFPGRRVLPYVLAQLAGSAAGTGLARLVWGPAVSLPSVAHAAIRPAPTWQPLSVFLAEAGSMMALIVLVGLFMNHARYTRFVPHVIGLSVALVIALLGPLSGGSINPARQFGPAAFSGQTTDLWIYLVAPVLGAALGALIHRLAVRRSPATRRLRQDLGTVPSPGRRHPDQLPHRLPTPSAPVLMGTPAGSADRNARVAGTPGSPPAARTARPSAATGSRSDSRRRTGL